MKSKLFFWLERPPFAMVGFLKLLKQSFGNNMRIFVKKDSLSNRNNFDTTEYPELECEYVDVSVLDRIDLSGSINVVNGFNSSFLKTIVSLKNSPDNKNIKVGVYSEMPHPMGYFKKSKSFLLRMKYKKILASKFCHSIDFLLPIGDLALEYFASCGWCKPQFPFLYLTDVHCSSVVNNKKWDDSAFCYIGRNDYVNKGLDIVIKYFVRHSNDRLIIVGDYGPKNKSVKRISSRHSNIKILPSVLPSKLVGFLNSKHIKCVLVPSRIDGWNPNTYLALISFTPCIATNKSGSYDLISNSGAGFVCKSSYFSFAKAIKRFNGLSENEKNILQNNSLSFYNDHSPRVFVDSLVAFLESLES